jgi:hypothetical protein
MNPVKARSMLAHRTIWVCSGLVNTHAEKMLRSDRERDLYFDSGAPLIGREMQQKLFSKKG